MLQLLKFPYFSAGAPAGNTPELPPGHHNFQHTTMITRSTRAWSRLPARALSTTAPEPHAQAWSAGQGLIGSLGRLGFDDVCPAAVVPRLQCIDVVDVASGWYVYSGLTALLAALTASTHAAHVRSGMP